MATVTVSTWADFSYQVRFAGNTVVVSPGVEWNVTSKSLIIQCERIIGNGAVIKGLGAENQSTIITIAYSAVVEGVKFIDCKFRYQMVTVATTAESVRFKSCTFTGRGGTQYSNASVFQIKNTDTTFSRCTFNIDAQAATFAGNEASGLNNLPYFRFCNISFRGSSFSSRQPDSGTNPFIGTIKAYGSLIQGELGAKVRIYQSQCVLITGSCTELKADYCRDILVSKNVVQTISETTEGDCSHLTTSELGTASSLLSVNFPLFHKEGGV